MTGQRMERRGGGNQEWFTGEHRKVTHESRSSAAENVTPNEVTGSHPLRRITDLKGSEGFLFVSYDDEAVRDQIRGRLSGHPLVDASGITVQVNNGVVLLSGAVRTVRELEIAEDVAASTRGVVRLRCDLRVMRR